MMINDTILFRRFMLVAAMIAAIGVGIAHLIEGTQSGTEPGLGFIGTNACDTDRALCELVTAVAVSNRY